MNFAKAQPLYERALRIYEKARGPEHADVAHCLTDLAVLHLEQVGCFSAGGCVDTSYLHVLCKIHAA